MLPSCPCRRKCRTWNRSLSRCHQLQKSDRQLLLLYRQSSNGRGGPPTQPNVHAPGASALLIPRDSRHAPSGYSVQPFTHRGLPTPQRHPRSADGFAHLRRQEIAGFEPQFLSELMRSGARRARPFSHPDRRAHRQTAALRRGVLRRFQRPRAAIRAGYGEAGTPSEPCCLQQHSAVAAAIREAMATLRTRCEASADRWLLEVLAISSSQAGRFRASMNER